MESRAPRVRTLARGAAVAAGRAGLKVHLYEAGPKIGGVDTEKVSPEMLEALGGLLQRKAEGLESIIASYERELLEEHPPTP